LILVLAIVIFAICPLAYLINRHWGYVMHITVAPVSPENIINDPINSALLPNSLINPKIIVKKSRRILELYSNANLVRRYPIGLGFNPVDDKAKEGDGCTPEGDFYICIKNPNSRFYKSLGLSYPNIEDAQRGLKDGLISKEKSLAIKKLIKNKRKPLWKTKLGGEIFIHGNGAGSDWTLGCIALEDAHIKELFDVMNVGIPVTIVR